MNPVPLISPRLNASIKQFFPSVATVKAVTAGAGDQDKYGAPHGVAQRTYTTRVGHEAIACKVAFGHQGGPRSSRENRSVQITEELKEFHIILNGYYPNILQTDVLVVDGVTYEIQGPVADAHHVFTHLHCRIVTA